MEEMKLPKDFSYEIRFYCDFCNEEILEDGIDTHDNECEQRNK